MQLAMLLTFLGPTSIYHVVSPATGAMHSPAAGFTPATPQPTAHMTTIYFTYGTKHRRPTTCRGGSNEDKRDTGRI